MLTNTARMADIFISYKREDKKQAALLADKLEAAGWSVWWDHDLLGGEDYDVVIERELNAATCVIVIWSSLSIQSRNVKDEAKKALNRGALIPVSFDNTEPPIGFGMTHVVLFENKNKISEQEYRKLYDSVFKKLQPIYPGLSPSLSPKPFQRKYVYYILGLIIIVAGYFIFNSIQAPNKTNQQTLTDDTTTNKPLTESENAIDTSDKKESTDENSKTEEKPEQKAEKFEDKLKRVVKDCAELFENTKVEQVKFNSKDGGYDCALFSSNITLSEFTPDTIFNCSATGGKIWTYQSVISMGTDSLEILKKFRAYKVTIEFALPDFKVTGPPHPKGHLFDFTDGKTSFLFAFERRRKTKTFAISILIVPVT